MLEPIKPGDDLYPRLVTIENGIEKSRKRPDWTPSKQLDLNIRTIKYLMQFPEYQYSIGVARMFSIWVPMAEDLGSNEQKESISKLRSLFERGLPYLDDEF